MRVRPLNTDQPESFRFSGENARWAKQQIGKYPKGREASAVMALLWRAQRQNDGWLSEPAIRCVADMLGLAHIRALEIATFYTMFNLKPVGKNLVQLCGTTPCWLRGADDLKAVCARQIGPPGEISEDGAFSWIEVECLGACVNAPVVQINDDYFEDLDGESLAAVLKQIGSGKKPKPGPQVSRQASAPNTGFTSLTDPALYDGRTARAGAKKRASPAQRKPAARAAPANARKGK